MDNLAKTLITDHKNPLVKLDLPGTKLFLRTFITHEEAELIEKSQNTLEKALQHIRVERRCGRAKAMWLPEQSLAKVTKVVKSLLKLHGFQDKNGIFLYPEEMLYLLETNRLEVSLNDIPISIQEAYDLVLSQNSLSMNIKKYRVYKKLAAMGYRLFRYEQYVKKMLKNCNKKVKNVGKETNDESSPGPTKKLKLDNVESTSDKLKKNNCCNVGEPSHNKGNTYIDEIFNKIRNMAPREYVSEIKVPKTPDFCAFLPSHLNRSTPDFNIFICEKLIDRTDFGKSPKDIFAVCSEDVSFYKVCEGHLPQI